MTNLFNDLNDFLEEYYEVINHAQEMAIFIRAIESQKNQLLKIDELNEKISAIKLKYTNDNTNSDYECRLINHKTLILS